jgi:hypothetical protein
VKNIHGRLWLWVGESKSREDSSESNSRADFEKHGEEVLWRQNAEVLLC